MSTNKTYCNIERLAIVEIAPGRVARDWYLPVGFLWVAYDDPTLFAGNACTPRRVSDVQYIHNYNAVAVRRRTVIVVVSRHEVCDEVNWRKRVGFRPTSGKVGLCVCIKVRVRLQRAFTHILYGRDGRGENGRTSPRINGRACPPHVNYYIRCC